MAITEKGLEWAAGAQGLGPQPEPLAAAWGVNPDDSPGLGELRSQARMKELPGVSLPAICDSSILWAGLGAWLRQVETLVSQAKRICRGRVEAAVFPSVSSMTDADLPSLPLFSRRLFLNVWPLTGPGVHLWCWDQPAVARGPNPFCHLVL